MATTTEFDKAFLQEVIKECTEEVFNFRKPPPKREPPEEMKKFTDIMKKYEDKVYGKYINKTPVATVEEKIEKQDIMNASLKHPFVGDATFLSNFQKLLRGYHDGTTVDAQHLPFKVEIPKEVEKPKQKEPTPLEHIRNYTDTQANSKYYFPQDHELHYDTNQIYGTKAINDISNQQFMILAQQERAAAMGDPYGSQNFGNSPAVQMMRSQNGMQTGMQSGMQSSMGMGQLRMQTPFISDDDIHIRRHIEMLGGIQRTFSNMERSLRDNELRNVEQAFKGPGYLDITSNNRVNNLLQNSMRNVYSPYFDAPDASVRGASPVRGVLPNLGKPALYMSPPKSGAGGYPNEVLDPRFSQVQTQPQIQAPIVNPITIENPVTVNRDALSEKSLNNSQYKPTFATSKALRSERAELLNLQYSLYDLLDLKIDEKD